MRSLLTVLTITLALTTSAAASGSSKLLTILTSPEPQTQLMAMVLSMQSLKKGSTVDILLCGPAGDMALKKAPASATLGQKPKDMSPQKLMQIIMQKGGTVGVCALYLPNKGLPAEALLDGVGQAKPPAMAGKLLADDTVVMSF